MSIAAQESKFVAVILPAAIKDDASFTTVEVDTAGYEFAQFYFLLGATDIGFTVLKMQESASTGTGMTDVTGLVWGTSNNISGSTSTLPSATNDDTVFIMDIALQVRQRYLDPVVTIGNGSVGGFMAAWCLLSRAHQLPVTAANRGATEILRTT